MYNFTSYNYYRLIVTKTVGAIDLSIADLSFTGSLNTSFANNDKFNTLLYNTNEKQFPPAVYTATPSSESTSSNEIFNISPATYYKQTLTVNSANYNIYSSTSSNSASYTKQYMFDYNTSSSAGNYGVWAAGQYQSTGAYIAAGTSGIGSTTPTYKGDWIIVQFPYPIILTKFIIYHVSTATTYAPKTWKCYGSTDGITWTEITDAASPPSGVSSYTSYAYTTTLPSYFDIPYLYIGWTFGSLMGTIDAIQLRILELQIFGKDDIANSYLNVWNKTGTTIYSTLGSVGIGTDTGIVGQLYVKGDINSTAEITAYYSDIRLKNITSNVNNALDIINNLTGFYYTANDLAKKYGYSNNKQEIGLSAQDVKKVIPEIVKIAPFDMIADENNEIKSRSGENYLTINYERIVPVLVEAIKELNKEIISMKEIINKY